MSIYDAHMYIHLISSNHKNNLYTSFYQYRGYLLYANLSD